METTEKVYKVGTNLINSIAYGKGKPLFLIPGWPISGRVYKILAPYLKDKYRVTSIDFPGWAGKSKFLNGEISSVIGFEKIIKEVVLTIYKKDQFPIDIGGVSAGGTLAMLFAAKNGDLVEKVFVHASPCTGRFILKTHKIQTISMEIARRSRLLARLLKYIERKYLENFLNERMADDLKDELIEDWSKILPGVVLDFANDFFLSDYSDILKKVSNKVIVVGSQKDDLIPASHMKDLAENILPNAKYIEVGNTDHYFLAKDSESFCKIIIENI